ncbi:MAG: B12-binding domain-containing radical SAM protein [Pirellulales bacterium]|nr:B12-binding domain-containing radical SAM protein [Pirellulales bacterium]
MTRVEDDLRVDAPTVVCRERHVTLVRPAIVASAGTWSSPVTPPMGLAYVAAVLLEHGTEVAVVDAIGERVEQFIEEDGYIYQGLTIAETVERIDPRTAVVGISCMFSQDWPYCRALIQAIRGRAPHAVLVAGGEHTTALAEYSLRDCPELNVVVLGEGEETFVDLVNRLGDDWEQIPGLAFLRDGRFVTTQPRARIRHVDDMPWPAWDRFPMEAYLDSRNAHGVYLGRSIGILATRGCPYKCTFCSNPVMYGNLWMPRSPEKVVDEIEHYIAKYGVTNIDFYDLTFILRRRWILEFCAELERRNVKITWQLPTGTRSEVIDQEVSAALFRTGCRNITYAPESGSHDTLKQIRKQVDLDNLTQSIRSALGEGIHIKVNMIVGFPHETRRHLRETLYYLWKLAIIGVHDAGVFMFSPYPGSQLFDELRSEQRIPDLNEGYFKSLVAFMDPLSPAAYCRHVSGRELLWWRLVAMASFFGLQYLVRPWRFAQLVRNLWNNESETVLEQRLGALLRRPKSMKIAPAKKPAVMPALVSARAS